jgi:hypothetical protein
LCDRHSAGEEAYHHGTGGDTDAGPNCTGRQWPGRKPADSFGHGETSAHRPLGIVFVGGGPTEVGDCPITEVSRNKAFLPLDGRGDSTAVGRHDILQVLGIEAFGLRANETDEQ